MPFGSRDLSHLPLPDQYSFGPGSDFFQVFETSRQNARRVNSLLGVQVELKNQYLDQVKRAQELTGRDLGLDPIFALNLADAGMRRASGMQPGLLQAGQSDKYLSDIDRIDAEIAKARAFDPNLKTFQDLYEQEIKSLLQTSQEAALASRTGGSGAWVPQFLGGLAGSLDPERDPLYFYSLLIGGGGSTVLRRIVGEMAIGGGVQAVQEAAILGKNKALGLPETDPFTDILIAALGAGVFRGASEAGALGLRTAIRSLPEGVLRLLPEAVTGPRTPAPEYAPRLSDAELLSQARGLQQTTEVRAATAGLERDLAFQDLSPLPNTQEGRAVASAQVASTLAAFEEGRPMNPSVLFPEGPTTEQVARDIAQKESIDLYDRIDVAERKIKEAEASLVSLTAEKAALTAGTEGGPLLNARGEPTGKRAPSFEQEILAVKERFNQQLAQLEQIRVEQGAAPNAPEIIAEKARISKQAFAEAQQIASTRFVTDRVLRSEIAKARRTLRENRALVEKLRPQVAAAEQRAAQQVQRKVAQEPAPGRTEKPYELKGGAAREEIVPPERVDTIIEGARQSLKDSLKENLAAKEKPGEKAVPPHLTVMGRDVPADMPLPGEGKRTAAGVIEEIDDEEAMLFAAQTCAGKAPTK